MDSFLSVALVGLFLFKEGPLFLDTVFQLCKPALSLILYHFETLYLYTLYQFNVFGLELEFWNLIFMKIKESIPFLMGCFSLLFCVYIYFV